MYDFCKKVKCLIINKLAFLVGHSERFFCLFLKRVK